MKQLKHSGLSFYAQAVLSKQLRSPLCAHFDTLPGRKILCQYCSTYSMHVPKPDISGVKL